VVRIWSRDGHVPLRIEGNESRVLDRAVGGSGSDGDRARTHTSLFCENDVACSNNTHTRERLTCLQNRQRIPSTNTMFQFVAPLCKQLFFKPLRLPLPSRLAPFLARGRDSSRQESRLLSPGGSCGNLTAVSLSCYVRHGIDACMFEMGLCQPIAASSFLPASLGLTDYSQID